MQKYILYPNTVLHSLTIRKIRSPKIYVVHILLALLKKVQGHPLIKPPRSPISLSFKKWHCKLQEMFPPSVHFNIFPFPSKCCWAARGSLMKLFLCGKLLPPDKKLSISSSHCCIVNLKLPKNSKALNWTICLVSQKTTNSIFRNRFGGQKVFSKDTTWHK